MLIPVNSQYLKTTDFEIKTLIFYASSLIQKNIN